MEFEKLEQECYDKYSPKDVEQYKQKKAVQQNKRKKKLFDDSDSQGEDEGQEEQHDNADNGRENGENETDINQ